MNTPPSPAFTARPCPFPRFASGRPPCLLGALACACAGLSSLALAQIAPFERITVGTPATDAGDSLTAAWADADGNGFLDLFVAHYNNQRNTLYLNNGDTTFTAIRTGNPVAEIGSFTAGAWADANNDGRTDLLVAGVPGILQLFRNDPGNFFTSVPWPAPADPAAVSMAVAWADLNRDGRLDFFVANGGGASPQANALYLAGPDGTFSPQTNSPVATTLGYSTSGAFADYDDDGAPDLVVANMWGTGTLELYHNDGSGLFTPVTNTPITAATGGFHGLAWGDFDNDGHLDLFTTGVQGGLFRNLGDGLFESITNDAPMLALSPADAVGCAWLDVDNDGWLDLFVARRGSHNALYRNRGNGTFETVSDGALVTDGGASNGCAVGDYDHDGYPDLYVANWDGQSNFLYRNTGGTNHWLKVRCVGTRSNRSGLGVKVRLHAVLQGQPVTQIREITGGDSWGNQPLLAHFGLGTTTNIDLLRLEWPSGNVQQFLDLPADQELTLTEADTGEVTISPHGGPFTNQIIVTLTASLPLAAIHYTLDLSEPTTNAPLYTEALTLTNTTTLQARLFLDGSAASPIASADFVRLVIPDIEFAPASGLFTNSLTVTLLNRIGTGTLHYTTDGSTPSTAAPIYTSPIQVTNTAALQAQLFFNGFPISAVYTASFARVFAFADDGLPFDWRESYFGSAFLTDPRAAADADPDADHYSNREEFLAGTSPVDPTALPTLNLEVRAVPRITFNSFPGRTYQILRKHHLDDPEWTLLEPAFLATNTASLYVDPHPEDPSYYEVRLLP